MHAIAAAVTPNEQDALPADIQWMPPGEHEITASKSGKPHTLTMCVKPEHAAVVNARLQVMRAAAEAGTGDKPFLDLNHNDEEASAHPTEAFWGGDDPKTGGIRMKLNWTGAGERAVRGKNYSRFSPSFYPDKAGNVVDVPVNMGGLVNRAAFQKIQSVVRSKSAESEEDPANQKPTEENKPTVMKSLLAVLAKLGLITSADVDEVTAATQVTENHGKLTAGKTKAEADLADVQAKLTKSGEELTKVVKAHATSVVDAAILAGRIPGQDDKIKAKWIGLIEASAENADLLPEPNEALKTVIAKGGAKDAKTDAGGSDVHPFMAKVAEYQAAHKSSEAFAIEAVGRTKEGSKLYDDYREKTYGLK